jgi:hypothetical protein
MTSPAPPTADDLERLAAQWFCAAQTLSARDQAEIEAWKKEHRMWMPVSDSAPAAEYRGDGRRGD